VWSAKSKSPSKSLNAALSKAMVHKVTQTDVALAELVREARAAAAVAEQQLCEGTNL
jgi:hypothetical protein